MTEEERAAATLDNSVAWSRLALVQAHAKATQLGLSELVTHIEQTQLRLAYIHRETACVLDDLASPAPILVVGF